MCSESLSSEKSFLRPLCPSRKLQESGSNGKVFCYKVWPYETFSWQDKNFWALQKRPGTLISTAVEFDRLYFDHRSLFQPPWIRRRSNSTTGNGRVGSGGPVAEMDCGEFDRGRNQGGCGGRNKDGRIRPRSNSRWLKWTAAVEIKMVEFDRGRIQGGWNGLRSKWRWLKSTAVDGRNQGG